MKNIKIFATAALVVVLIAVSCSSSDSEDSNSGDNITTTSQSAAASATTIHSATISSTLPETPEEFSVVVPFTVANGSGTITVFGNSSPVVEWFGNQLGEVSLDLVDADATDEVSMVEELISFWFFQDDNSGDAPPSIFVFASGGITDSVGTSYVVEAQLLPPAPGTETTTTTTSTTTTSTTTTTSSVPSVPSVPPSTTSTIAPTTTPTTITPAPAVLQVQVLNGSGVAGAAGRMTDKLSEAGYVVLSPANAPQRYSSSAVYYAEGWQTEAAEILAEADIDEIEEPTAMPRQFASEEAVIVVLLGTDTAPVRAQASLRPRQRNNVRLPLGDDVPRDRYVPGLSNINIYSQINDQGPHDLQAKLQELSIYLRYIGNYQEYGWATAENRDRHGTFLETAKLIEDVFLWMGFTPQNVCGAPPGSSFTDLLQPTREWSEEFKVYRGDAIFTTDRLIELHGGPRINPESNLDVYIREAVQTAYDSLRLVELLAEIETPQMILCFAWKMPSGEIPEMADGYVRFLALPVMLPQESLLSQGTYHFKEISRNGNFAYLIVCHPTIGERYVWMWWREHGYRAEVTGNIQNNGCQATYESDTYLYEDTNGAEDTIRYRFSERVFSASDMQEFPRS